MLWDLQRQLDSWCTGYYNLKICMSEDLFTRENVSWLCYFIRLFSHVTYPLVLAEAFLNAFYQVYSSLTSCYSTTYLVFLFF